MKKKTAVSLVSIVFGGIAAIAVVPLYFPLASPQGLIWSLVVIFICYAILNETD